MDHKEEPNQSTEPQEPIEKKTGFFSWYKPPDKPPRNYDVDEDFGREDNEIRDPNKVIEEKMQKLEDALSEDVLKGEQSIEYPRARLYNLGNSGYSFMSFDPKYETLKSERIAKDLEDLIEPHVIFDSALNPEEFEFFGPFKDFNNGNGPERILEVKSFIGDREIRDSWEENLPKDPGIYDIIEARTQYVLANGKILKVIQTPLFVPPEEGAILYDHNYYREKGMEPEDYEFVGRLMDHLLTKVIPPDSAKQQALNELQ